MAKGKLVTAYEIKPGDVVCGEVQGLREKVEEVEHWGQTLRFNFASGRSVAVGIHAPVMRF